MIIPQVPSLSRNWEVARTLSLFVPGSLCHPYYSDVSKKEESMNTVTCWSGYSHHHQPVVSCQLGMTVYTWAQRGGGFYTHVCRWPPILFFLMERSLSFETGDQKKSCITKNVHSWNYHERLWYKLLTIRLYNSLQVGICSGMAHLFIMW